MTILRGFQNRSAQAVWAGILLAPALGAWTADAAAATPGNNVGALEHGAPEVTGKIAPDLVDACRKDPAQVHRVLVQLDQTVPGVEDEIRACGGQVRRGFSAVPMMVIDADALGVTRIAQKPFIRAVSPDRPVTAHLDLTTAAVGATLAHSNHVSGNGVTVAVLDSGIARHPDLTMMLKKRTSAGHNRIIGWVDLVNNRPTPYDDCGHGTHVAGIIAGNGYLSQTTNLGRDLEGVAPAAKLVGVKVLDQNGRGTVSTVIAGIDWCVTHHDRYNIRVLNLSLGTPVLESYTRDPLCQACEAATQAGLLVVAAAGNLGRSVPSDPNSPPLYGTIDCPGNDPLVLTVGAAKTLGTFDTGDDAIASYSSRGPTAVDFILKPDLVAPGNRITSLAAGPAGCGYMEMSGTSMAAPVAAGAAALLLSQDDTLTPADLKGRLMLTATKVWRDDGTTPDIFSRGAGYLNIPAALACTEQVASAAASPSVTLTDGMVTLSVDHAIWGDHALWGDQAIWSDHAIWGDHALWGDGTLWSDHALWGDTILGSDHAIWGDDELQADRFVAGGE